MTDCPNVEMRDRLPDLLHEQLDASARAAVMAHVSGCADCRAELALLRQMRVSLSLGIVAVDTAAIAQLIVAGTMSGGRNDIRARSRGWRLAAAAVFVAAGGATALMWHARDAVPNDSRLGSPVMTAAAPSTDTAGTSAARVAVKAPRPAPKLEASAPRPSAELAAAGDVSELSESDLRTLLGDLDTLEAVPSTEPEPVTVRVNLPERGGID
jgi:anti-sigma factor RsiW